MTLIMVAFTLARTERSYEVKRLDFLCCCCYSVFDFLITVRSAAIKRIPIVTNVCALAHAMFAVL